MLEESLLQLLERTESGLITLGSTFLPFLLSLAAIVIQCFTFHVKAELHILTQLQKQLLYSLLYVFLGVGKEKKRWDRSRVVIILIFKAWQIHFIIWNTMENSEDSSHIFIVQQIHVAFAYMILFNLLKILSIQGLKWTEAHNNNIAPSLISVLVSK